jgi:hypothetical protein
VTPAFGAIVTTETAYISGYSKLEFYTPPDFFKSAWLQVSVRSTVVDFLLDVATTHYPLITWDEWSGRLHPEAGFKFFDWHGMPLPFTRGPLEVSFDLRLPGELRVTDADLNQVIVPLAGFAVASPRQVIPPHTSIYRVNFSPAEPLPEPATALLCGVGLVFLAHVASRRRRS